MKKLLKAFGEYKSKKVQIKGDKEVNSYIKKTTRGIGSFIAMF